MPQVLSEVVFERGASFYREIQQWKRSWRSRLSPLVEDGDGNLPRRPQRRLRRTSPLHVYYPLLFQEAFPEVSGEAVRELALADRLLTEHLLLFDRALDDADHRHPVHLLTAHVEYGHSLNLLYRLFPVPHPFWEWFGRCQTKTWNAVREERLLQLRRIAPFSFKRFRSLALGKTALLNVCTTGLCFLTHRQADLSWVASALDAHHLGLVLLDDLEDWKEDFLRGNYTFLLTRLLSVTGLAAKLREGESQTLRVVGTLLYATGLAEEHLRLAEACFRRAAGTSEARVPSCWRAFNQGFEQRCRAGRRDLGAIRSRAKSRPKPTRDLDPIRGNEKICRELRIDQSTSDHGSSPGGEDSRGRWPEYRRDREVKRAAGHAERDSPEFPRGLEPIPPLCHRAGPNPEGQSSDQKRPCETPPSSPLCHRAGPNQEDRPPARERPEVVLHSGLPGFISRLIHRTVHRWAGVLRGCWGPPRQTCPVCSLPGHKPRAPAACLESLLPGQIHVGSWAGMPPSFLALGDPTPAAAVNQRRPVEPPFSSTGHRPLVVEVVLVLALTLRQRLCGGLVNGLDWAYTLGAALWTCAQWRPGQPLWQLAGLSQPEWRWCREQEDLLWERLLPFLESPLPPGPFALWPSPEAHADLTHPADRRGFPFLAGRFFEVIRARSLNPAMPRLLARDAIGLRRDLARAGFRS